jgi:hypothetical protein
MPDDLRLLIRACRAHLAILIVSILALGASSCSSEPAAPDTVSRQRNAEAAAAIGARFRAEARGDKSLLDAVALLEPQAWGNPELQWPSPRIAVCWESAAAAFPQERLWVANALERSWEAASAVDFTGWANCPSGSFAGVRVTATTGQAQTSGTGTQVRAVPNGVQINFTFAHWNNEPCNVRAEARESCIKATAVHEFGHVLGFVHEHNRHESWGQGCTVPADDGVGSREFTAWDGKSVMNYCNKDRLAESGKLSDLDKAAVALFYGRRT